MLDNQTKKRIDDCRDILVGKITDPKSQVEQITIAMIYKFMDDMDLQSEEYGGSRQFFVGDYQKYSWSKIFSPRVDAYEMLNLYGEGIEKMSENPNLNPLFRSIFKDAYLPYRDPETLKLFLKTIDGFSYEHSEKLGDAYEYLLSVLGSQGGAGQFRTPRHIIDFIVDLVEPKKGDRILDPACGTSGFLISSYKRILERNTDKKLGDKLSSLEKKQLLNSIYGYDLDPNMVRLSLVNLFLHGFTEDELNVIEYDSLTSEDRWNEYFDVILANPPFMTPKGGIRPHNRFSIKSNRAEVLFVNYIMEHLTPKGRAGIIVPEGIIFQSGTAYKQLRKSLIDKYLIGVISLPNGVFNPYSGVKTSILILDKELSQKTDRIFFGKVQNDGYDLGAQRREIDKNDLPKIKKGVLDYVQNLTNGIDEEHPNLSFVSKEEILNSHDLSFNLDSYYKYEYSKIETDFFSLKDLVQVEYGKRIVKKNDEGTLYPVYGGGGETFKTDDYNRENRLIISRFAMSPLCVRIVKDKFFLNDSGFTIKVIDSDVCHEEYLNSILLNIQDRIYKCGKGAAQKNIDFNSFYNLKIPLPPLEIQKEIVEELEQYQKIIDGAKQVVDNYKPHIDIDESWDLIELQEVCEFKRGPFGGSLKKEIFVKSGFLVYEQFHAINDDHTFGRYFINEEKYIQMKKFSVEENDLLISCSGTMGKITKIPKNHRAGIINQALLRLRLFNKDFNIDFIRLYLNSNKVQKKYFQNQRGVAIQNVMSVKELKRIKIPKIHIDIQNKILEEIGKERVVIKGNKKLIEIYTQKIENRINKIWGE